tara:strand:- start:334 stop:582 length:249 start_codon:yes stop_codon:yes gene_type:complete
MELSEEQVALILAEFTARYRAKFNKIPSGGFWLGLPVRSETDADGFTQFSFNVMSKKGLRAQGSYTICSLGSEYEPELSLSI